MSEYDDLRPRYFQLLGRFKRANRTIPIVWDVGEFAKHYHRIDQMSEKLKLEVGKFYQTTGGHKVYIGYMIEDGARWPFVGHIVTGENDTYLAQACWDKYGRESKADMYNLLKEWKEPAKGKGWVNIYRRNSDNSIQIGQSTHPDIDKADIAASDVEYSTRIARIKFEWTEGQFDE